MPSSVRKLTHGPKYAPEKAPSLSRRPESSGAHSSSSPAPAESGPDGLPRNERPASSTAFLLARMPEAGGATQTRPGASAECSCRCLGRREQPGRVKEAGAETPGVGSRSGRNAGTLQTKGGRQGPGTGFSPVNAYLNYFCVYSLINALRDSK